MQQPVEGGFNWFVTCPKGLEGLLLEEIHELGGEQAKETVSGVRISGAEELGYRLCLWSRLANRVLLQLQRETISDSESLYQAAYRIPWQEHFDSEASFSVDFIGTSQSIRNTQYGAQRVKDAIVDRFRASGKDRPSVSRSNPDIRINVRLSKELATFSLDFSGESLHRRSYRQRQVSAPLKENLAAALLLRAKWPSMAREGGAFVDLMCGSGTLVIEALMMAADIAPGLLRKTWGFQVWKNYNTGLWQNLVTQAEARQEKGLKGNLPAFRGYDTDSWAIGACLDNAKAAGFEAVLNSGQLGFETRSIENSRPHTRDVHNGLILTNPPYGERLGEVEQLAETYRQLGTAIKQNFPGWQAAIITSNPALGFELGLKASKKYRFFNGVLRSELLLFDVRPEVQVVRDHTQQEQQEPGRQNKPRQAPNQKEASAGVKMLINRLKKNQRKLKSWVKQNDIECYRLYDADLPEYAVAIDIYGPCIHVQEYAPPASIDPATAKQRIEEVEQAVNLFLGVVDNKVFFKRRERQKGSKQYQRVDKAAVCEGKPSKPFTVNEGAARFEVRLDTYLDTGLFLDSRPIRQKIAALTQGKRFLNLFCYTATATVQAALGYQRFGEEQEVSGANSTLSIDLSKNYLAWAEQNFRLNGLNDAPQHQLLKADCLDWLEKSKKNHRASFDVILLDPPTFSNSKKMDKSLDIQRDHPTLIQQAMAILAPGGTLVFVNNFRRFKMDSGVLNKYEAEDISRQTLDPDFIRKPRIHHCWLIRHKNET